MFTKLKQVFDSPDHIARLHLALFELSERVKTHEQTQEQLEATQKQLITTISQLEKQIAEFPDLLTEAFDNGADSKAAERAERIASDQPFFEIVSDPELDENGQVQLQFDWNDAFVAKLRKHNYPGTTEEQVIANWMKTLGKSAGSVLSGEAE